MTPLQIAIEDFLAFGQPREGSFRYHDAWKKLQEEFKKELITKESKCHSSTAPHIHS